jgi:hypothetical protein
MRIATVSSIVLAALVAAACGADSSPRASGGADVVRRDSAGVEVVEVGGGALDALPEWTVSAPRLTVGGGSAEGPYALHRVAGALLHGDGGLLVAQGAELLRFDGEGRFERRIGRRGEGPGEYSRIGFIAWHEAGVLVLDDLRRQFTVLDDAGNVVEIRRLAMERCGVRISFGVGYPCEAVGALEDGTVVTVQRLRGPQAASTERALTPGLMSYVGRFGADGFTEVDSLSRPVEVVTRMEQVPLLGERPFSGREAWAVGRRLVALGVGDRFEIRFRDAAGDVVRVLRVARAARPVGAVELEALRAEPFFAAVLEAAGAADSLPFFEELRLDDGGRLWAREYAMGGWQAPRSWLVFDADGRPLARATLPGGMQLLQIGADFVVGLVRDEHQAEQVVVLGIERAR